MIPIRAKDKNFPIHQKDPKCVCVRARETHRKKQNETNGIMQNHIYTCACK